MLNYNCLVQDSPRDIDLRINLFSAKTKYIIEDVKLYYDLRTTDNRLGNYIPIKVYICLCHTHILRSCVLLSFFR